MVFCGACDFGIRYLFPEGGILNLGNRDVAAQWSVKNDKISFSERKSTRIVSML